MCRDFTILAFAHLVVACRCHGPVCPRMGRPNIRRPKVSRSVAPPFVISLQPGGGGKVCWTKVIRFHRLAFAHRVAAYRLGHVPECPWMARLNIRRPNVSRSVAPPTMMSLQPRGGGKVCRTNVITLHGPCVCSPRGRVQMSRTSMSPDGKAEHKTTKRAPVSNTTNNDVIAAQGW